MKTKSTSETDQEDQVPVKEPKNLVQNHTPVKNNEQPVKNPNQVPEKKDPETKNDGGKDPTDSADERKWDEDKSDKEKKDHTFQERQKKKITNSDGNNTAVGGETADDEYL